MKFDRKEKKTLNRNPFNEKLIHRFYMEALYFYEDARSQKLIPKGINPAIRLSNLALVVPEDGRKDGYRPDFILYFKNFNTEVPVEIKWKSSDFVKEKQVNFIKENGGFLVTFIDDAKVDVPTVKIDPKMFQDWLAKRIYTLSRDSLSSKDLISGSSNKWIVSVRGETALENFNRMQTLNVPSFWAFKNSKFVTSQIFNLQKNDEMIFLFFKSSDDKMGMSPNQPSRNFEILGWAEVTITEPYYICLEGDQASFFEGIRKESEATVSPANRKWVHFIDFQILDFRKGLSLKRKRGDLDHYLVNSSNQGGALLPIPQSIYDNTKSFLKTT